MAIQYTNMIAIPFGSYKGVSVKELMDIDPGWLVWATENIEGFDLHPSLYDEAKRRIVSDPRDEPMYDWFGINDEAPL